MSEKDIEAKVEKVVEEKFEKLVKAVSWLRYMWVLLLATFSLGVWQTQQLYRINNMDNRISRAENKLTEIWNTPMLSDLTVRTHSMYYTNEILRDDQLQAIVKQIADKFGIKQ